MREKIRRFRQALVRGAPQSTLVRTMLSYVVVIGVLFGAMAIYMNNEYKSSIRDGIVESNINRLSQIAAQTEEYFNTMINIADQIGLSPYIKPFRFLDDPMKAFYLKTQLAPYAVTNGFINQLFLIFHQDTFLYSPTTSMPLSLFLSDLMRFEHVSSEEARSLLRGSSGLHILPCQRIESVLLEDRDARMVTVIAPIRQPGTHKPTGNVVFMIPDNIFLRLFADATGDRRDTYILHGESVLIASVNGAVSDQAILEATRGNDSLRVTTLTENGDEYLLIAQRGRRNGMQYVALVPKQTLSQSMARARVGFFLFLLALAAPCVALTFYLAKRQIRPIQELRRLAGSALSTPIAQTKDDIAAIRSGIEALVGLSEDLHTRLDGSLPARRTLFVLHFVKGRFTSRQDAIETAARFDLSIDCRWFALALITLPHSESPYGEALLRGMERMLLQRENHVTGWGVELVAQTRFLLALFADDPEAIGAWVDAVKEKDVQAQKTAVIALSGVHEDFSQAGAAFLEANAAYDHRFVMGTARVLRFQDISTAVRGITPFAQGYVDSFRKAVREGNANALDERISELFQRLGDTGMSLFAFRTVYNDIIETLWSEYYGKNEEQFDILQYYDVFTLSNCRSIEELDATLRGLCRQILAQKQENAEPEAANHSVILEIAKTIRDGYANPDLSLSELAGRHGVSAAWLSLHFKERMGMNPSEYLLLLRMEKAKALLSQTDLPVKDICVAVGYYDVSGFIRRFRRHMAMTPAQYRQSLRGKKGL